MAKMIIYPRKKERNALEELAQRVMRVTRAQTSHIIRQEFVRQDMPVRQSALHQPGHATQQAEEECK